MNEDSILKSIKSYLGIADDDSSFDLDVLMNINAIFSVLYQIGVGNRVVFISSEEDTWSKMFEDYADLLGLIKQYTFMKTRVLFDPPTNSFVMDSLNKQIQETEWRIKEQAEGGFDEEDYNI